MDATILGASIHNLCAGLDIREVNEGLFYD
jgi:hypothetical protein